MTKRTQLQICACMIIPWVGCLPFGCTHTINGTGELGFKQSTEWGLYTKSVPITEPPATASQTIEADSILELFDKPEPTEK